MAELTAVKRRAIWQRLMEEASANHEVMAFSKSTFQAAIDATDTFIDDAAVAFNNALPAAARTALTTRQKARLFFAVAEARFGEA